MAGGGERFVDLDRSHGPLLAALPVRRLGQPHTRVVAEGIAGIAPYLGTDFEGVGLLEGIDLRAVAIWRPNPPLYGDHPPTWELSYLATHSSFPRRGYARRAKIEALRRAQRAGIVEVISHVHRDNGWMLSLNDSIGGERRWVEGEEFVLIVCRVEHCLAMATAAGY
jgi:GNAT superfamily N-acetyltransferase